MAVSEDAKLISAAILTLAGEMVRIEKKLDKSPVNDESVKQEITKTFAVMQELLKK